ncbi:unnamed protein product [Xylocopa violacea]|uniref:RRM domain-containing protein n=1 Tax=Xylocopa violacea TaxID=135666 RepID=A0ABP1NK96_XYLVO
MTVRYFISVRNIPWTVSHLEFENYFSSFGMVKYAKVIFDKCGLNSGYGFVEFYDKFAMSKAVYANHILEEEKLLVVQGLQYLEEANLNCNIKGVINEYIKNFKSNIKDNHIGTNYTEDKYISSQHRNFKLNNLASHQMNDHHNLTAAIEQLLRNKHIY